MRPASGLGALPRLALAGLGTGWLRPAPGTWASLAATAACAAAEHQASAGRWAAGGCLVLGSLVTLAWGGRATDAEGRHDPGWVVSDEWAGQGLAWLLVAWLGAPLPWLLATLPAFRLLDIGKPGPIRAVQRVPGGAGVLLDDLLAGLGAALLVGAAWWWLG